MRQAFNQSRIAVYHDEKRQEAFLRATAGVLRIAQITREDNRYHPDRLKLENGQRFDSHETNRSKFIVSNLVGSWLRIFGRFPSGKNNSIFFHVMNDLLSALGQEQLGEAALKSMLPKK